MTNTRLSKMTIPLLIFGLTLCVPAFAQESSQPSAGESMKRAGTETENAAKHAWEGTKTAALDTKITAKVKMALHNDELTSGSDIEVHTTARTVALTGKVPSGRVAAKAEELAQNTEGVRTVDNQLQIVATSQ